MLTSKLVCSYWKDSTKKIVIVQLHEWLNGAGFQTVANIATFVGCGFSCQGFGKYKKEGWMPALTQHMFWSC